MTAGVNHAATRNTCTCYMLLQYSPGLMREYAWCMHALGLPDIHLCSWLPGPRQIFSHFSFTTVPDVSTRMLPRRTMKSTDLLKVRLGRKSRLVWDNAQSPDLQLAGKLNQKTFCTYLRLGPLSYDPTDVMLASLVLLCNAMDLALLCSWEDQALEKICLLPSLCYPNPGASPEDMVLLRIIPFTL